MKKWHVASIVALALLAGCAAAVYLRSGVASVNGDRIMPSEFYRALQRESGRSVLDSLILERLIKQEGKRLNISVTDAEVDKEISAIKEQFGSESAFQSALKESGLSMAELRDGIRTNQILKKITLKDVTISEDDIKKYFEENKESLGEQPKARVRHILVKTREEAEAILKRIRAGEDFANLAAALSTDETTKFVGGDLGFITPGEMEEAFDKAAFSLQPGEVSEVVETPYGFHLLKVESREEGKEATLEESRERIVEALETQKAKPAEEVISELRNASSVKVFWDRYKSLEHVPVAPATEPEK